jgi:hypothetical protein
MHLAIDYARKHMKASCLEDGVGGGCPKGHDRRNLSITETNVGFRDPLGPHDRSTSQQ